MTPDDTSAAALPKVRIDYLEELGDELVRGVRVRLDLPPGQAPSLHVGGADRARR